MNAKNFGMAALTAPVIALVLGSLSAQAADRHGHMAFGQPGKAAEVRRTIAITMGDNFFEPGDIEILKGETVRFVIRNGGRVVHEFNIGTPDMHVEHQAGMQMMVDHGVIVGDRINRKMMKMDMGGGKTMEHDDPNSVLLEPGQTAEIIWKFSDAMPLEFACNLPGRYDAGMVGGLQFVDKLTGN